MVTRKKATASPSRKKRVVKKQPTKPAKVDYYPNRMTVAVSALAGTILVLMAIIAVLGSQ